MLYSSVFFSCQLACMRFGGCLLLHGSGVNGILRFEIYADLDPAGLKFLNITTLPKRNMLVEQF